MAHESRSCSKKKKEKKKKKSGGVGGRDSILALLLMWYSKKKRRKKKEETPPPKKKKKKKKGGWGVGEKLIAFCLYFSLCGTQWQAVFLTSKMSLSFYLSQYLVHEFLYNTSSLFHELGTLLRCFTQPRNASLWWSIEPPPPVWYWVALAPSSSTSQPSHPATFILSHPVPVH